MKKITVFLSGLLCILQATAQLTHVGLAGGLANYTGDLVDKYYVGKMTNGFIGASLHYEYSDQVMLRATFNFARVNGDDQFNSKQVLRDRNLRFESVIAEFTIGGEYYFFNLYEKRFSPYLFVSAGAFYMNPYAHDSAGKKVYLKPLSTEGQGIYPDKKPYHKVQPVVPFGGGVKFVLNENIRIGLEIGIRKTFTDYLDDVSTSYPDPTDLFNAKGQIAVNYSYRGDELPGGDPAFPTKATQRGGAKQKDIYYFTGLNITYRLASGNKGGIFRPGTKNRMGCPTVPL